MWRFTSTYCWQTLHAAKSLENKQLEYFIMMLNVKSMTRFNINTKYIHLMRVMWLFHQFMQARNLKSSPNSLGITFPIKIKLWKHRQHTSQHIWYCSMWFKSTYSLSGKTSYRQISWILQTTRLDFIMIAWFWNVKGISAALLQRCLSNFRAIRKV